MSCSPPSGAARTSPLLAGLLLVRRRHERLARLMDDVDAVLGVRSDDPPAALAALDRLQERFDALESRLDDLLAQGRLPESHHVLLATRVERAGARVDRRAAADPSGASEADA